MKLPSIALAVAFLGGAPHHGIFANDSNGIRRIAKSPKKPKKRHSLHQCLDEREQLEAEVEDMAKKLNHHENLFTSNQLIEDNLELQKQVVDLSRKLDDNDIPYNNQPLEAVLPCASVANKNVTISTKYKCGYKETGETLLYYPTGDTGDAVKDNYPVVFFHPGSSGFSGSKYSPGYVEWARKIAGQCVVVVVPKTYTTKPTSGSGFQDKDLCQKDYDLKLAYEWAKPNLKYHVGASINFNRIGLMGHSAGGHHIPKALSMNYFPLDKVYAIIFSHSGKDMPANTTDKSPSWPDGWPGYWPGEHRIPTMMITSAKDCTVRSKKVLEWYKTNKAKGIATNGDVYHTVFASTGGSHMEPVKTGYFSTWMGRFMACHLTDISKEMERKKNACKYFYGTKDGKTKATVCSADHLSVTPSTIDCKTDKDPDADDLDLITTLCDHHGTALA